MQVDVEVRLGSENFHGSEIEGVQVRQELGRHTSCSLHIIRDTSASFFLSNFLGKPLEVRLMDEHGHAAVVFEGAVTSGRESYMLDGGLDLQIEALSPSTRLDYRHTALHKNQTLEALCQKLNVSILDGDRSAHPKPEKPLDYVQYGETEFDFLCRIADDHGLAVRTAGPSVELMSKFVDGPVVLDIGVSLLSLSATCRPVNHGFKSAGFDWKEKRDHRFHGVRETPLWLGGAQSLVSSVRDLAPQTGGAGDPNIDTTAFRAGSFGDQLASLKRESERALGTSAIVEGSASDIRLKVGETVEINGAGSDFSGKYGLTRVTHRFEGHDYQAEFQATPWARFSNYRKPSRRLIPGVMTAIVTNVDDPMGLYRVRVRFPWVATDTETRWIPLATPHAGNGRGFHFLPEIGDEILVAFEQGDPERPIGIGSLFNGKDVPPKRTEKNGAKHIVTRSGNTIMFIDDDGKEAIEVHSAKGEAWMRLENANGKAQISMHSEGDILIEAKGELRLRSNTFIRETDQNSWTKTGGKEVGLTNGDLIVETKANYTLDVGMNLTAKAGMMLDLIGGAISSLVGKMVHIQPPGHMAKPVIKEPMKTKASPWKSKSTPELAEHKATADAVTPRQAPTNE